MLGHIWPKRLKLAYLTFDDKYRGGFEFISFSKFFLLILPILRILLILLQQVIMNCRKNQEERNQFFVLWIGNLIKKTTRFPHTISKFLFPCKSQLMQAQEKDFQWPRQQWDRRSEKMSKFTPIKDHTFLIGCAYAAVEYAFTGKIWWGHLELLFNGHK